jgi:hypothetical protein
MLETIKIFPPKILIAFGGIWSEPLQVDNELSNIDSWREVYEKDEATLRPRI